MPDLSGHKPIRIAHIITRMIVGGAQENTLLSVEGLDRYPEYEVTLITGVDQGPEGDLLTRARDTTRIIVVPELARSINPAADIRALWKLFFLIRKGRYHLVHTHSSKAGVLGRIAAWLAGTPIIVHTLHSLVFHEYQPWVVNRLFRIIKKICAPMTDHFVSVSEIIKQKAIAAGVDRPEKFSTIYSGMELDWFLSAAGNSARVRQEFGIPLDAPVVGKVARLFKLKGHDQLFDAAQTIVRNTPNVRFLLIGDGILFEHLQRRATEMGILENFVFAGLVPRERIPEMIGAMDIVVHTSLREGLARVLPQALAMGKPCVSFDIDGAPEVVIPGRTGFLVEAGDSAGLADAILKLIGDRELRVRMGDEGRRLVDPKFRSENMVAQIAGLYSALMDQNKERLRRFDARWSQDTGHVLKRPGDGIESR